MKNISEFSDHFQSSPCIELHFKLILLYYYFSIDGLIMLLGLPESLIHDASLVTAHSVCYVIQCSRWNEQEHYMVHLLIW